MIIQENIPYTKGEIEAVIRGCFVNSRLDAAISELTTSFGYLAQQENECIGMITEKLWGIIEKSQKSTEKAHEMTVDSAVKWLEENVWELTGTDYSTLTDSFREAMQM